MNDDGISNRMGLFFSEKEKGCGFIFLPATEKSPKPPFERGGVLHNVNRHYEKFLAEPSPVVRLIGLAVVVVPLKGFHLAEFCG